MLDKKKRLWRLLSNELSRLVSFGLEKMLIVFLWVEQMWHLGASCSPWLSQECGVNFSWQADSQFVPISRLSSICAFFKTERTERTVLLHTPPQEHGSPRLTIGHLSSKKGEQEKRKHCVAMCCSHRKMSRFYFDNITTGNSENPSHELEIYPRLQQTVLWFRFWAFEFWWLESTLLERGF